MIMFIIVGSMYDFYSKEDSMSKCKLIFVAFSIQSNLKKLFYNSTKNTEFSCFYFLKALACVVILFGHRMMYSVSYPVYNMNDIETAFEIPFYGIFINGPIVVDIFFTISGFLTFISMYNALEKIKRCNVLLILFLRWCRLIPVYGLMIVFIAFVFFHVSDGPMWKSIAVRESENCLKNWWTNVLFVNNYVDTEHPCVMQSWYLACDLHMCALGVSMVYLVWKYPKCEKIALLTAILASCFASAYIVYQHNYYPTFIGFI
ncbi:O-acyltransferase like protein-like, partial [Sipha flava]|uniref:O-acyltransferase like protein-like n=1 Tax=Sipha flava TaxID=143950 RepID=A0A8B8GE18_9HEMI